MMTPLVISPLRQSDCAVISDAFTAQGWNKPVAQYENYLAEQTNAKRAVLVAEWENEFAGYVTIVWESHYAFPRAQHIPEIVDLNVLIRFRRRGVATGLLEHAEQQVGEKSKTVGIGVGLTADYGAAQMLYVRRGYIPNGQGIVSNNAHLKYGDIVRVDDDLVLYLTKQLQAVS